MIGVGGVNHPHDILRVARHTSMYIHTLGTFVIPMPKTIVETCERETREENADNISVIRGGRRIQRARVVAAQLRS